MIKQIEVSRKKGDAVTKVPCAEYDLMDNVSVAVLGVDFNSYQSMPISEHPEMKFVSLGKLYSDMTDSSLVGTIEKSLIRDEWNFRDYPDPEVMEFTMKTVEEVTSSFFPTKPEHAGEFNIITAWDKAMPIDPAPFKTIWPGVPTWEDIIEALIAWSKKEEVQFYYILTYARLQQEGAAIWYRIPPQIVEWAYTKFRGEIYGNV